MTEQETHMVAADMLNALAVGIRVTPTDPATGGLPRSRGVAVIEYAVRLQAVRRAAEQYVRRVGPKRPAHDAALAALIGALAQLEEMELPPNHR